GRVATTVVLAGTGLPHAWAGQAHWRILDTAFGHGLDFLAAWGAWKRDPQRPRSIWWLTDADFVGFRVVCPVEEQENLKKLRSKVTLESK
ncbi:MAG: hypothetical protein ACJ8FY_12245, partial [Gemmataceae bacterium]